MLAYLRSATLLALALAAVMVADAAPAPLAVMLAYAIHHTPCNDSVRGCGGSRSFLTEPEQLQSDAGPEHQSGVVLLVEFACFLSSGGRFYISKVASWAEHAAGEP
jgi:hypothetical protein